MNGGRLGVAGAARETDGGPEDAALAGFADDAGLTAHQRCQAFADGQPETGATVFAGGRLVRLREGLEEAFLLLGADADSLIFDLQAHAGRRAAQLDQARTHGNLAVIGKLDRVADEVEEDLS
ncbi:MAG: hypothetical protein AW11_03795 [Candidatus Accumulibacter regalis]|uniref:Uncharacterized protein n=1 Tax=Accumulibacter regalis TaxID=522306 RepID=A0A011Q5J3_ACCRE|nr:MAG: hypothetical protein AW11_03795 [Candidatus Accumulibacter regalis]